MVILRILRFFTRGRVDSVRMFDLGHGLLILIIISVHDYKIAERVTNSPVSPRHTYLLRLLEIRSRIADEPVT